MVFPTRRQQSELVGFAAVPDGDPRRGSSSTPIMFKQSVATKYK